MLKDHPAAVEIQKDYYGKPQELAQKLAEIAVANPGIVEEVFNLLDNYSKRDVGSRFVKIMGSVLWTMVKTPNGYRLCQRLYDIFFLDNVPGSYLEEITLLKKILENNTEPTVCINCAGVNPLTRRPGIFVDKPVLYADNNADNKLPAFGLRQGIFGQIRTGMKGRGGFKERPGDAHDAIDIRAPQGSEVYANRDGVVVLTKDISGYGNIVTIKHEPSGSIKQVVYTHYAHLKSWLPGIDLVLNKGRKIEVKEGQLIGYSGATGNAATDQPASEDHVHFGVSLTQLPKSHSKDWMNPVKYLNESILTNKE